MLMWFAASLMISDDNITSWLGSWTVQEKCPQTPVDNTPLKGKKGDSKDCIGFIHLSFYIESGID